jgi:SOS-response transcriptional repressor LexA
MLKLKNATLKRVMKMGDMVLLVSKNKDYEPIQVKSNEVKILGGVRSVEKNII